MPSKPLERALSPELYVWWFKGREMDLRVMELVQAS